MPSINFNIRWPDGREENCYSPSTIVRNYLHAGDKIPLSQFLSTLEIALEAASNRVRKSYGYSCSSAMHQLSVIQKRAADYRNHDNPEIEVISVS